MIEVENLTKRYAEKLAVDGLDFAISSAPADTAEGSVIPMTSIDTAEALFASYLQPSDHPTSAQVTAAVSDSLRRLGGQRGCAAVRATAYGDHPDTAAERMRWALAITKHLSQPTLAAA